MRSFGDDAPILIRTKLQRPQLGSDIIPRPHLIDRLNQCAETKLTLISAQAGAGKTTLLAQWLHDCPQPSAWVSLDQHDNDLMVFVRYLCAAIQTVFPKACEHALDLLAAPFAPPPRIITTSLVNDLNSLLQGETSQAEGDRERTSLLLVLDDYQNITDFKIHEFISETITYLPRSVRLVLATRRDPPLPLAGLRANNEMSELRTIDLRFTKEEARAFLELTTGRDLSSDTIDLLKDKTDGWAVGLRLTALSIDESADDKKLAEGFKRTTSSAIVDYLVSEVLSQQTPTNQDFLQRTSILDRFCAGLCDFILKGQGDTESRKSHRDAPQSRRILQELKAANLFLIPLDEDGEWFRYHQLFRDLLQNRLRQQLSLEQIAAIHNLAGHWFEQNGFIDEALDQAFSAGELDRAARIVSRQRYGLMNQARWQRLERYLRRFPQDYASQQPDLLMLNVRLQRLWDTSRPKLRETFYTYNNRFAAC